MTRAEELKALMEEWGIKYQALADYLMISRQLLRYYLERQEMPDELYHESLNFLEACAYSLLRHTARQRKKTRTQQAVATS